MPVLLREGSLGSCNSVRLSVTCVDCDKTEQILQIFWYHTKGQSFCYSDTSTEWHKNAKMRSFL